MNEFEYNRLIHKLKVKFQLLVCDNETKEPAPWIIYNLKPSHNASQSVLYPAWRPWKTPTRSIQFPKLSFTVKSFAFGILTCENEIVADPLKAFAFGEIKLNYV